MDDHVALAVQRLDHPLGKRLADTNLGFGYARKIIDADLAERSIAGGERDDCDAGVQRLAHHLELGHARVGKDDDDIEILRDQATNVGDLLLSLELAVRVADFLDVGALGRLLLELRAGDLAPIIAAPTVGVRNLEILGATIFRDVFHILDAALLVRGQVDIRELRFGRPPTLQPPFAR